MDPVGSSVNQEPPSIQSNEGLAVGQTAQDVTQVLRSFPQQRFPANRNESHAETWSSKSWSQQSQWPGQGGAIPAPAPAPTPASVAEDWATRAQQWASQKTEPQMGQQQIFAQHLNPLSAYRPPLQPPPHFLPHQPALFAARPPLLPWPPRHVQGSSAPLHGVPYGAEMGISLAGPPPALPTQNHGNPPLMRPPFLQPGPIFLRVPEPLQPPAVRPNQAFTPAHMFPGVPIPPVFRPPFPGHAPLPGLENAPLPADSQPKPKKALPGWLVEEIKKKKAEVECGGVVRTEEASPPPGFAQGERKQGRSVEEEAEGLAAMNQEIKRVMTEVLMKVTDELVAEVAQRAAADAKRWKKGREGRVAEVAAHRAEASGQRRAHFVEQKEVRVGSLQGKRAKQSGAEGGGEGPKEQNKVEEQGAEKGQATGNLEGLLGGYESEEGGESEEGTGEEGDPYKREGISSLSEGKVSYSEEREVILTGEAKRAASGEWERRGKSRTDEGTGGHRGADHVRGFMGDIKGDRAMEEGNCRSVKRGGDRDWRAGEKKLEGGTLRSNGSEQRDVGEGDSYRRFRQRSIGGSRGKSDFGDRSRRRSRSRSRSPSTSGNPPYEERHPRGRRHFEL